MDPKFPFNPFFPQFPCLWPGTLGFPYSLGGEGIDSPSTENEKPDAVCSLGNSQKLDVVCMEERFLAAAVDIPESIFNQGVAHCGWSGSSLAERIFVTGRGEELLRLYREKNSGDIYFKPDCSLPVLWDLIQNSSDHGLSAGIVSFLQMKGKSLWVPMNLCTDVGYINFTIRRPQDLKALEEYLNTLIVESSINIYACYVPQSTPWVPEQNKGGPNNPALQPVVEAIQPGEKFSSTLVRTSGVLLAKVMQDGFAYSAAIWLGSHLQNPQSTPQHIQPNTIEEEPWAEEGDEIEWDEEELEGE